MSDVQCGGEEPLRDGVVLRVLVENWLVDHRKRLCWGDEHVRKGRAAALEFEAVTKVSRVIDARRRDTIKYVETLLDQGLERKTVANRLSLLRRFGDWLLEQEILTSSPFEVPIAKSQAGDGCTPFTVDEVRRLIAVARESQAARPRDRRYTGEQRADYYAFLFLTGLRRKESKLQLREHVDLDGATMRVSADKAGRGDFVPLVPEAVELLRRILAAHDGPYVFARVPRDHTLANDMRAAGVDDIGGKWHRFRKAGVTTLGESGAPLRLQAAFARQVDLRVTAARYDKVRDAELRCAMSALTIAPRKFLKVFPNPLTMMLASRIIRGVRSVQNLKQAMWSILRRPQSRPERASH